MIKKISISIFLILLVTGCASNPPGPPKLEDLKDLTPIENPLTPTAGKSVIHYYRVSKFRGSSSTLMLGINDGDKVKPVAKMANGTYHSFEVIPGTTILSLTVVRSLLNSGLVDLFVKNKPIVTYPINTKAGESYWVRANYAEINETSPEIALKEMSILKKAEKVD